MRITFGLLIGIIVCFISTDAATGNEFYKKNNLINEPMFEMKDKNPSNEQTVYMSELLMDKYPETCKNLIAILEKHHVKYSFIKGTKDIWCRDYMPVQTESGKFIQFRYEPSYLKGKKEWEDSRSDVKEVCRLNNIDATFSDINLDGGNVLICDGRAILSDRIFSENPDYKKDSLISELSKLLECEIIIIPAQKGDYTGHADGMVRFVDRNTILGNKLADECKYWQKGMQKVIDTYNLTYIDVPFITDIKDPKHPGSAIGIYVNFLEVNDLIVMPIFNRDEDRQVLEILQRTFPNKIIETIDYNDVAKEGGLLNCTTWVVR
ncbi:MAG: agmatine deiminase family protein [Bacteroidales bacterium]|nr:agmatine deiminase family protein [Bacteroidales bacterium]